MFLPLENPSAWAKRYLLPVEAEPCHNCGKMLTPSVPFAEGYLRGLETPEHGCPARYTHRVMISLKSELGDSVAQLAYAFSDFQSP